MARADTAAGQRAYEAGDYRSAAAKWGVAAQVGDAVAQYSLGRLHEAGEGVIQDFVQAHLWYNLAASGGHAEARAARDRLAATMSADQIAEAQALARAWRPAVAPTPAAPALAMAGDPLAVLMAAIEGGDPGAVSAVLDAVPDVNVRDGQGWTPMSAAALGGDAAVLAALLGAGADPNLANADGVTPLMVAAVQGHRAAAEALLAAGAEAGAKRADGLTAAKLAEMQGHAEIAALLGPAAAPAIVAAERTVYVQSSANLRAGPGKGHAVLTVVPPGTALTVTGTTADGKWHRIALPDKQAAFIHASLVGAAAPSKEPAVSSTSAGTAPAPAPAPAPSGAAAKPGRVFRDCAACPEIVVIPVGSFLMGSPASEPGRKDNEGPQVRVTIARSFALGKYEVTFAEWDACVAAGVCRRRLNDEGWGRGRRPVIGVSWDDARDYVQWLTQETGQDYRLATEAEWEYAARAGTKTARYWGSQVGRGYANCEGCGSRWDDSQTAPVGSFGANAFGLHDMFGNVWEWVEDCYGSSHAGASATGAARFVSSCRHRTLRGGGWLSPAADARAADREGADPSTEVNGVGFRIARSL